MAEYPEVSPAEKVISIAAVEARVWNSKVKNMRVLIPIVVMRKNFNDSYIHMYMQIYYV